MNINSTKQYLKLVNNAPEIVAEPLREYAKYICKSDIQNHFSEPMVRIGMYIAVASLVCILAMVVDILHGLRSRKLWFPCRYFRVNAAFLSVIAVAMKLPVDLAGSMMGLVDKMAKLGSMAFMCTMMANLLPCLATMGNDDLLSNITALCVLVITLVVNVCIQIRTGVLSTIVDYDPISGSRGPTWTPFIATYESLDVVAIIYVIFLGVLLLVHVCTCLAILGSKSIIESKYQELHERASKEIQPSPGELITVEKLKKHVTRHWIMAGSGSPQLITACLHTTYASGVICLWVIFLHIYTMSIAIDPNFTKDMVSISTWSIILEHCNPNNAWFCDSDYGWSMSVILMVQFFGVMISTIAPLARCFAILSFKVSPEIISNHIKVFKVEHYWTQKLYDWKHTSIRLPFRSRNPEVVIETLKRLIFNLCIGFQIGVVVVCKVITVIPFMFIKCVLYCFCCIKPLLKVLFSPCFCCIKPLLKRLFRPTEKLEGKDDLRLYVLQLEDEMELGERTLARLLKSVERLFQKGEKTQDENLMKLLKNSTNGFQGVRKFDHIDDHEVPFVDCWVLSVVTLTTIAKSLLKTEKEGDSLLESVREGLEYVTVVEKNLNTTDDHVRFQKVANTLWGETKSDKIWLGHQFQDPVFQENKGEKIVEWFRDKAKIVRSENDVSIYRSICAKSMYCISETILLTYHTNNDATVSQEQLFNSLESMIADIIAACLTNLPQAITKKCHTSVIEEREASVKDAAQLLGKTTKIIEILEGHEIPRMDPSDMPFLRKWHAFRESLIP